MKKISKAAEITDAKISFVSLVDRPANKREFLIMKQERSVPIMASNEKSVSVEELKEILVEAVAGAMTQVLENASVTKSGDISVQPIQKSGQHYLHGFL